MLGEAARGASRHGRRRGKVHADADDRVISSPLEQDAAELGTIQLDIIRPFEPQALRACEPGEHRLVHRQRRHEGQARRGRITQRERDERGAHVIARCVEPAAALAPAPFALPVGDEPEPLGQALSLGEAPEQVGIGRTRLLDVRDGRRQSGDRGHTTNSDAAARLTSALSQPVARKPSGEITSAEMASSTQFAVAVRPSTTCAGGSKNITLTILM